MAIREFQGIKPTLAGGAFVDEMALVVGDVCIGENTSVWPMSVVRGDVNSIKIGARSNIQDGSVVHVTHAGPYTGSGLATTIGDDVTIGHRAIIHACMINDRCLIGMGAIVMDGAIIESDVVLAAGGLVSPGKVLRSGHLYVGSPAKEVRKLRQEEIEHIVYSAQHYVKLTRQHRQVEN